MVDPLEAAVQLVLGDATLLGLSGGQIAGKARYGGDWAVGSKSVVMRLDGGTPDIYAAVQDARIEVRCYAGSQAAAFGMIGAMIALGRVSSRVVVDLTGGGKALVHYFLQASGISYLYDADVEMDYGLVFMQAMVVETPLP